MRLGLLALAVVALCGFAACGGGSDAELLTLAERVPGAAEAPESEPDPVEKRRTASGFDEFVSTLGREFIELSQEERRELGDAGFVSGISDTRFFPREPGAEHIGSEPHVFSLVMRFTSDDGAKKAVELLHADGLSPCPQACAENVTEFEVDGTPDAKGVRRVATAEDIEAVGEEGEPHDSYAIRFSDGPFAYAIQIFGPPGEVSEKQVEEIVEKLFNRVEGAPPPEG
jgi:hypothetical protein